MIVLIFLVVTSTSLSAAIIPFTSTRRFGATATTSFSSSLSFSSSSAASSASTNNDLSRIPIVLCPGFGNDSSDYINPFNRGAEYGFITALTKRGFSRDLITPVPIKRWEWLRVAFGLFDIFNFYTGTCKPTGLGYGWYISRLRQTIEQAYLVGGNQEKVILIGHSAGGWLARAALGDGSWAIISTIITNDDDANISSSISSSNSNTTASSSIIRASDRIRALITLGAIHKVPAYSQHGEEDDTTTKYETYSSSGGGPSSCVTRGALAYVNTMYPGPYLSNEGVTYISVGGDAIVGVQQQSKKQQKQIENEKEPSAEEAAASSVAYTSYRAVCGNGNTTGDGVVPLAWTLLDGSQSIILPGVYHSINKAGTALPNDNWYGGDNVIDFWLYDALDEMGIRIP